MARGSSRRESREAGGGYSTTAMDGRSSKNGARGGVMVIAMVLEEDGVTTMYSAASQL